MKSRFMAGLFAFLFAISAFAEVSGVSKTWENSELTLCADGKLHTACAPGGEYSPPSQFANSLILDSFEYGSIPAVFTEGGGTLRYLWEHDDDDSAGNLREGTLSLNTTESLFGSQSLQDDVTSGGAAGSMFINFYNNKGAVSNDWNYLREHVNYTTLKTYNRMRYWVKVPPTIVKKSPIGSANWHTGIYLRNTSTTRTNNESDNWHFYHYANLEYTGNWQQIIIDPHPDHQRGESGAQEQGIQDETTLETGYDYFDLATYFYVTNKEGLSLYPGTFLLDGFEIYEETADEDINHIYSLTGVRSNITGEVIVSWRRLKPENDKTFDVKYAFDSFYGNGGWTYGFNAPAGQNIDPQNLDGYNGVEYRTNAIDITGQDAIYIAIKHQDEAVRFREIRIPLTSAGYPGIGGG